MNCKGEREKAMTDKTNSRRGFLKATALGAAGLALGSRASSYTRIQGANNRVRVGIVGFSDRCSGALVPAFLANAKDMNFDFVAVSDIWSRRRKEGAETLAK